jgi:hypothetical protein
MDQNKVTTPPNLLAQDFCAPQNESDVDVWEPPFERWIKLADNLLTGWVCVNASLPQRRQANPRFVAREF